ncbi:MAG: 50S ribosomal protein L5 [Thaumarchaeota archaeon]|jgi:large subunit ribosomal protein L5|nr:50S ribosomal protein L5 [Nitrososphaerota archaeon]
MASHASEEEQRAEDESQMRRMSIGKVVINIGVGKSGEAVERARKVLEQITAQKPASRKARKSIRDFGTHEGEPIGLVVTARGQDRCKELITRLLAARDKKLKASSFDPRGSVSFGLKEHIEIPGIRYDPEIGIWGMNVSILLERPGYRVSRRQHKSARVGKGHFISQEEAIEYFKREFGVVVE